MKTDAIVMSAPGALSVESLQLKAPTIDSVVVRTHYSGISTGTEKLLWTGRMPSFPGMGYPLVPGYESFGEVVEAGALSGLKAGDHVFVPGSDSYEDARGLFGGAAATLITTSTRCVKVDAGLQARGALLALAATARHAIAGLGNALPDLIVGHGVMGRLLARLTIAAGGKPPVVWDLDATRRGGDLPYPVLHPDEDKTRSYNAIYDVSGDSAILDTLIGRLTRGGEIALVGFYSAPLSFAFPPAFMKEARFRIAAEWTRADMIATRMLVEEGVLDLDGLITHERDSADARAAYVTAFEDASCLKMILNWKGSA